jgi:hypothetical protein
LVVQDCCGPALAQGVAMGKEKMAAKGKEGLQDERLSLVHRYMTDAAAGAPAGPRADDPATSRNAITAAVASADQVDSTTARDPEPLAQTRASPAEPGSTAEVVASPTKPERTPATQPLQRAHPPASQLLHQARLPIYKWARADTKGEPQTGADWPHELVRLREARDRAHKKPT